MKPEFLERSLQGYAVRSLEQAERLSGGHADTVRVSVCACVREVRTRPACDRRLQLPHLFPLIPETVRIQTH